MLKCNGKTFMNLQEAVQWLLNNNALFFMCNEDYAADTEISLEELVNPSPANPKIGSLVLFADGNIAAITGITDDSFIVGSDSINIRMEKTVTHFEIDASQHLIVHYSDGTADDLGSIFSGNVNIAGTLTVDHAKILETIEDASARKRFIEGDVTPNVISGVTFTYHRWSLSGTHLMLVLAGSVENATVLSAETWVTNIQLPLWIRNKIDRVFSNVVDVKGISFRDSSWGSQNCTFYMTKNMVGDDPQLNIACATALTLTTTKYFRIQFDFLIDNA